MLNNESIEVLNTQEDFATEVANIKNTEGYEEPIGFGIATVNLSRNPETANKAISAVYIISNFNENSGSAAMLSKVISNNTDCMVHASENEVILDVNLKVIQDAMALFNPYLNSAIGAEHKNVQAIKLLSDLVNHPEYENFKTNNGIAYRLVMLYKDTVVETVESSYIKLDWLSKNKAPLRSLVLEGVFGKLETLAWSGNFPYELDWLEANEMSLKATQQFPVIDSVDKFPRYLHHIVPGKNIRILDSSKVRYGAQLAEGTVVMPGASYINFNAGTEGPVMVEGRISSSAKVGANSDVGGGASILGVLSGTDGDPITIGENCLLGANSVTGIPLGDGCIVDAGIAVLPGTKFVITADELAKIIEINPDKKDYGPYVNNTVFKGSELAGLNGLHFRLDTTVGKMIVKRSTKEVTLNADLH